MDIGLVMQAIADTITGGNVTSRAYAWPAEQVSAPCAVVGYPTELDFDATFMRGADRAIFPVYLVVGRASDRASRDVLSALITDATGIKGVLDGTLGDVVQTARLTNLKVETVTIGSVSYLAAVGEVEVYA